MYDIKYITSWHYLFINGLCTTYLLVCTENVDFAEHHKSKGDQYIVIADSKKKPCTR